MEARVRQAALQALRSWQKTNDTSTTTTTTTPLCGSVHPDCAFWVVGGNPTSFRQASRPASLAQLLASKDDDDVTPQVNYVKILPVGLQSAASVQVSIASRVAGFLVLLRTCQGGESMKDDGDDDDDGGISVWQVISVALAQRTTAPILPETFDAVTALTWKGYCHANLTCDGDLMAQYFHATCRLTYVAPNKTSTAVHIVDAADFYDKVRYRYTAREPLHVPFAHLKDNLPLLSQGNTLLGVDFVSPYLAMVTLKVGHPPFLWTDLLTCACDNGRWWIVHKSSDSEPYLLEHARPPTANGTPEE